MHLRRREFLIHILALRIVNTGKPVSETTYRQELEQVQQEIGHLAQEIENIVLESTDILNDVLCKCHRLLYKQTPVMR
jgi:predicted ester cyclase